VVEASLTELNKINAILFYSAKWIPEGIKKKPTSEQKKRRKHEVTIRKKQTLKETELLITISIIIYDNYYQVHASPC